MFHGRADQVSVARHEVSRFLAGCPVADDAVLVTSELASNAVLHSGSRGQFFTLRCERFPGYVWIEVEDLGGHWGVKLPDAARPHGLDIVDALCGEDNWGVDGDERGHVVWCRLEVAQ
jgi:anti-sigma regulatory factor (Ser/Thr protein kinase)